MLELQVPVLGPPTVPSTCAVSRRFQVCHRHFSSSCDLRLNLYKNEQNLAHVNLHFHLHSSPVHLRRNVPGGSHDSVSHENAGVILPSPPYPFSGAPHNDVRHYYYPPTKLAISKQPNALGPVQSRMFNVVARAKVQR